MFHLAPAVVANALACEPLNEFEKLLSLAPPCEPPKVNHRFTRDENGKVNLYSRECILKADNYYTSRTHRTEHQFIISRGVFEMWSEETGWIFVNANLRPYHGITKAGTRRAFKIIELTFFTTFHATSLETVEEIEAQLVEPDARLDQLKAEQNRRAIA
jgi:hypothetical protein